MSTRSLRTELGSAARRSDCMTFIFALNIARHESGKLRASFVGVANEEPHAP